MSSSTRTDASDAQPPRPSKSTARTSGGPIARLSRFFREVIAELRKVIWPTRKELVTYTTVVLVFVVFMVLLVSLFDFAFSQGVLKIFGGEPAEDV